MRAIAIDTGPLVALFDGADKHHRAALQFVQRASGLFVTNIAVLTETAVMLDFSSTLPSEFLDWAAKVLVIDQHTDTDLTRIAAIMRKYSDLPADFADAALLAMCERREITEIATVDRDFNVYRISKRGALKNVFFGET